MRIAQCVLLVRRSKKVNVSIVFTQEILSEMEDDCFNVSQSGDVIPTQDRMVRDRCMLQGLLHGLDARN